MKLALVQMHANDKFWEVEKIPELLATLPPVDLAIFPECMPFYRSGTAIIDELEARERLESLPTRIAFIAGGYVRFGDKVRNVSFLVDDGKIVGTYFKRRKWRGGAFCARRGVEGV